MAATALAAWVLVGLAAAAALGQVTDVSSLASGAGSSAGANPAVIDNRDAAYDALARDVATLERELGLIQRVVKLVTPTVVKIEATPLPQHQGLLHIEEAGSGVIVEFSSKFFVLTNRHVIRRSSPKRIDIHLADGRVLRPTRIWSDSETDVAVMAIDAPRLAAARIGDSDRLQIGEYVLAMGSPFGLSQSVTRGIISAKGRHNLRLGDGDLELQDFIQTDAAINPGNSGGALVNTKGELIGINSAIASQTGSYSGYAFAIPVNLAKKILDDLKQYGSVKRGVLGVAFPSPSAEEQYLKQQGIAPGSVNGVFITGVVSESAAAAAGLKEGDIIQSIDGLQLVSSSEFSERIARHRPGDVILLGFLRNGKATTVSATLKGEVPTNITSKSNESLEEIYNKLGVSLAPLTDKQKQYFNLNSGVMVTNVRSGGFFDQIGIPSGTIIAFINGKPINSSTDVDSALLSAQRGIIKIFAIAPDGSRVIFNFSLGT